MVNASPEFLKKSKYTLERIERVRQARLQSGKARTKMWAEYPSLFTENRQPKQQYLGIPKVSSENRIYLPVAFLDPHIIASGSLQTIPGATIYHFGILTSAMHMAWMRHVCGRMKSDYQYSNSIVYNNFPWPENPGKSKIATVEKAAKAVLDARTEFQNATLADLYDPNTMPPLLLKAHKQLDKAVDAAYGRTNFATELERMEVLFEMYKLFAIST